MPAAIQLQGCEGSYNFPTIVTGNTTSPEALGGMQQLGNALAHTATHTERPSANTNLTWVKGSHTFKVGAEAWFQAQITAPPTGVGLTFGAGATSIPASLVTGAYTVGFPYASFLLGDMTSATQYAPVDARMYKSQWAMFLQDSWKITRKLSLDYGAALGLRDRRCAKSMAVRPTWASTRPIRPRAAGWARPSSVNLRMPVRPELSLRHRSATGLRLSDRPENGLSRRLGRGVRIRSRHQHPKHGGRDLHAVRRQRLCSAQPARHHPATHMAEFRREPDTSAGADHQRFSRLPRPARFPARRVRTSGASACNARSPATSCWKPLTSAIVASGGPVRRGYINQVTPQGFAQYGLSPYSNATDNLLLGSAINSTP